MLKLIDPPHDLSKSNVCDILGIKVFDTALPQSWFEQMCDIFEGSDKNPLGHFVWCYDVGKWFGAPRPLTVEGAMALAMYNGKYDTSYPVNEPVINL